MNKIITFWIIVLLLYTGIAGLYAQSKEIIYAGTFSSRGSKGIYVFEFDRSQGKLRELQTVNEGTSPGFITLSPDRKYLYAIYVQGSRSDGNGSVMSFKIDRATGFLTKINEQSAGGKGPAHISIDPKGRFAYVSNYGDGNLSVLPINKDGSLGSASDFIKHTGRSIVTGRQDGPHVHSIIPSPNGKFIYASDLGIDKVMIYRVQSNGKLTPAFSPFVQNVAGSGPRHFVISPNNKFAYSVEELSSTVASFRVNKGNGALSFQERLPMLPSDFKAQNSAADIHFSPDGKFLYASNRGHESLVIYNVDAKNGKISVVGHESTGGKHPRNFMIDKKGEFVFTANQNTDNIVVFIRDKETGKLTPNGQKIMVPSVTCLVQL